MIKEHLDKNNLHHAYLIEGARDEIVSEILTFCENLNIKTSGNPDFCHIVIDNFKMEDALNLREMGNEKSFSLNKKIFVVCSNSLTLDAQGTLLKMFEEPTENTHFFLIVPDINFLLKTLISRFYLIKNKNVDLNKEEAEKFLKMSIQKRIDFIKELLVETEEEDEEGNEIIILDSTRSKALKFLNVLELIISKTISDKNVSRTVLDTEIFNHFFKVREFLRMPGSSVKTLMESVALILPIL